MKKNIFAVLILIGLIGYGVYDYLKESPSEVTQITVSDSEAEVEVGIQKGQLAPDFTLVDLQGTPIKLSDYKGKKVLLNFWATWCPPCRVEMPHMQQIYDDYQSKDVVILGVNLTYTENHPDDVEVFLNEEQFTFPIVLDEEGEAMMEYQVFAYPTTYLLDSNGVIQEKIVGAMSYETMEKYVSKVK